MDKVPLIKVHDSLKSSIKKGVTGDEWSVVGGGSYVMRACYYEN
jgi:uncharacterized membrane protein